MARLIIKNGYIKGDSERKGAHLKHIVQYIATRDGVEKVSAKVALLPATQKQKELLQELIETFPNAKENFEYQDYVDDPTVGNASELIEAVLEQNFDSILDKQKYLSYIANRPNVEKISTHGLFGKGDDPLVLSQIADEVANHTGNVWTPIISLRREDAIQLGMENASAWKSLLKQNYLAIASSLKIAPENLRYYAAFHNEGHHPHIHMICYSTNPKEGYLSKVGIEKVKSTLARNLFKETLLPLYIEKTERRDDLKREAGTRMREIIMQMQTGMVRNETIELLMQELALQLKNTKGKKQYGYLRPALKNIVDQIVDELAKEETVAGAYAVWQEIQQNISTTYSDQVIEPIPLSKCKEFKPIRNMVIQEAVKLSQGEMTFEEPQQTFKATLETPTALPEQAEPQEQPTTQATEPSETEPNPQPEPPPTRGGWNPFDRQKSQGKGKSPSWWTDEYKQAKAYLHGDEAKGIQQDLPKALAYFLAEAQNGNPLAMSDLGRMFTDGLGCEADAEQGHAWYAKALAGFEKAESEKPWKYTQYRIGKMYASGLGTEQDDETAAAWLAKSANEDYKYAQYSLAGLYAKGQGVAQDEETAFALYKASADQSFPYASFEVGKRYASGTGIAKDAEASQHYYAQAFEGFLTLEAQSHDDKLQYKLGTMLLKGIGTEQDIALAKEYFTKAATVGNTFACYQLAKMILTEPNPPPDEVAKAFAYLHKAAEDNNPHAQYTLGKLYQDGTHTEADIAKAMRFFHLSAENGNDFAAYRLGKLYLGGSGALKDISVALHWFGVAAEQDNQYAQYALGAFYLQGDEDEAIPKNIEKAVAYLRQAAGQENMFAQYKLGKVYLLGEDVPKDIEKAISFLQDAAWQGNEWAQYTLGKLYLMNQDIPRDNEKALQWLNMSATQGNEYAQFLIDHFDNFQDPSLLLSTTRLLHQASKVFEDNTPLRKPNGGGIDRKRKLKLNAKRMAQGHKQGDHEEPEQSYSMSY